MSLQSSSIIFTVVALEIGLKVTPSSVVLRIRLSVSLCSNISSEMTKKKVHFVVLSPAGKVRIEEE